MLSITDATIEFQSHFDAVYAKHGQQNGIVQKFLTHKLRHVYWVLDATLRVIASEPELTQLDRETKRKAEVVALRHDIGRYYQVRDGRIVWNREYEHGDGAYHILIKKYPDLVTICLAVKIHNKLSHESLFDEPAYKSLNETDQKEALLLTKIIRDADKLQNMTYDVFDSFRATIGFDKYVTRGDTDDKHITGMFVSDAVLESFKQWKMCKHADVQTVADSLLTHYAWMYDINYDSTRWYIAQMWFVETLFSTLKELGVSDEQLKELPRL